MSNSKGWLEFGLTQHLDKRTINLQRKDNTRERGFEPLAEYEEVNIGEMTPEW